MNEQKIVALYTRVSTGYQIDKDSLPFQKKELSAYCKHILHAEKMELFEERREVRQKYRPPGVPPHDKKDPRRGNIPRRRL